MLRRKSKQYHSREKEKLVFISHRRKVDPAEKMILSKTDESSRKQYAPPRPYKEKNSTRSLHIFILIFSS